MRKLIPLNSNIYLKLIKKNSEICCDLVSNSHANFEFDQVRPYGENVMCGFIFLTPPSPCNVVNVTKSNTRVSGITQGR